jgi:hypothetical protein
MLPAPWSVVHSVAWQSTRNGRQGDGEADFVAVHPEHGLLVIEVKGGGVTVDNGRWFSTDQRGCAFHPIKNPFEQAVGSKHALVRFVSEVAPSSGWVQAGHAVAFPGLAVVPPSELPQAGISSGRPPTSRTSARR